MSGITVVNNTTEEIYVCVSSMGSDNGQGSEEWYVINGYGGSSTWSRTQLQIVNYVRSKTPGIRVETALGVPGETTRID
ncbi:hypothetical protein VCV18_005870 [Metarhizium anisopliae]